MTPRTHFLQSLGFFSLVPAILFLGLPAILADSVPAAPQPAGSCNWTLTGDAGDEGNIYASWELSWQAPPGAGFSPISVSVDYRIVNTLGQAVTVWFNRTETGINVFGSDAVLPYDEIWNGNDMNGNPVSDGTYIVQAVAEITATSNGSCVGDTESTGTTVIVTS